MSVPPGRHIRMPRNWVQALQTKAVAGCQHRVHVLLVGVDDNRGGTGPSNDSSGCICAARCLNRQGQQRRIQLPHNQPATGCETKWSARNVRVDDVCSRVYWSNALQQRLHERPPRSAHTNPAEWGTGSSNKGSGRLATLGARFAGQSRRHSRGYRLLARRQQMHMRRERLTQTLLAEGGSGPSHSRRHRL